MWLISVVIDFFKTTASLFVTALYNLPLIVVSTIPYLLILAAFGVFVLWNGGVVLGKPLALQLSYLGSTF